MNNPAHRTLLTVGEPAGIGPDIVTEIAAVPRDHEITALVDPRLMDQRAQQLGSDLRCRYDARGSITFGSLSIDDRHRLAVPVCPGVLDSRNAEYVHQSISSAVQMCLDGNAGAMVTAPVHKGIINDAGIPFSGHTELIAELCGVAKPVMMLANRELRVALVTTHLPLREVADAVTEEAISAVVKAVDRDLRARFRIAAPRLLVCGLNPHAGEGGHLGREEIEIIEPALESLRAGGVHLTGPVPADTAFAPHMLEQADAVLAMYHDQGLPVIKAQGFGQTVNITLGLPIIRTSVDHGTALALAGTGKASAESLLAAIEQALTLSSARND